jgi:SET domain-containing protein
VCVLSLKTSVPARKYPCGISFLAKAYPKLVVIRRSSGSLRPFWSLETLQEIDKGEFVLEATGEVINGKEDSDPLLTAPLYAQLSLSMVSQGSLARFLQHNCDPTLALVRFCSSSDLRLTRVLLFAQKSLSKCEELSVDFDCLLGLHRRIPCVCGSALCRGHIGVE